MADCPIDQPDELKKLTALARWPRVFVKISHLWSLSQQKYPYKDTHGISANHLVACAFAGGERLLRCLFDLGLRRAEVVQLDFEDLNRQAGTLAVLGKGRTQKDLLTLPPETKDAIEAWLVIRGEGAGPLFLSMNRARKGNNRLTGIGLYEIVRSLGAKAGLRVWPHGLRHAAITEALDLTGGNVRAVQKFSRHRDVRIIERYDDNRLDLAGQVARQVAASVSRRPSAA